MDTMDVMYWGTVLMIMGFLATWTEPRYGLLEVLFRGALEEIGRWLMRVGAVIFSLGFVAHLATLAL